MNVRGFISIAVNLAFLFAFYWFFRWTGWKGMLAFIAGMFLMAYLLLSKSPVLLWLIRATSSDQYLWEMLQDDKKDRKVKEDG